MSDLLTATEAARFLKVHKATLYRWTREGTIPAVKPGGRVVRYSREQLSTWLALSSNRSAPVVSTNSIGRSTGKSTAA